VAHFSEVSINVPLPGTPLTPLRLAEVEVRIRTLVTTPTTSYTGLGHRIEAASEEYALLVAI